VNQAQRRATKSDDVKDDVETLITGLGQARLMGRVPFEAPVMIQTANLEHHVGRYSDQQLTTRAILTTTKCLAGACNSVLLPKTPPAGLSVVDVQLLVWGSERRSTERELVVTNVTAVKLLDGSQVMTGALTDPLQVSIPLRPESIGDKKSGEYVMPVCQYWNVTSRAWRSDGCIAVGDRSDSLDCSCFHTTDFAGLFRAALFDLGRSDEFLTDLDTLVGREPHQFFVIMSVGLTSVLATILMALGYRYDVSVSKAYAPSLRATLFERGYLHAATRRLEQRFRSLFVDLWARRTAHLLQTRHAVMGIFFRHSKDPYDRASRIACVGIHVVACMCLNIVWLGAIGAPDGSMLAVGIFTGLILIPVLPMCAVIFKTVAPAQRDRRKKNKKRDDVKAKIASARSTAAEGSAPAVTPPRPTASRRSRVEVAGTVEAVDNVVVLGQGDIAAIVPEPPDLPRTAAVIPPSRRSVDYNQLQEAVPRTFQSRGPRTPEVSHAFLSWPLLSCSLPLSRPPRVAVTVVCTGRSLENAGRALQARRLRRQASSCRDLQSCRPSGRPS